MPFSSRHIQCQMRQNLDLVMEKHLFNNLQHSSFNSETLCSKSLLCQQLKNLEEKGPIHGFFYIRSLFLKVTYCRKKFGINMFFHREVFLFSNLLFSKYHVRQVEQLFKHNQNHFSEKWVRYTLEIHM